MHARPRRSVKRSLAFLVLGAAFAAGFAPRALAAWGSAPVTVANSAGALAWPSASDNHASMLARVNEGVSRVTGSFHTEAIRTPAGMAARTSSQ